MYVCGVVGRGVLYRTVGVGAGPTATLTRMNQLLIVNVYYHADEGRAD